MLVHIGLGMWVSQSMRDIFDTFRSRQLRLPALCLFAPWVKLKIRANFIFFLRCSSTSTTRVKLFCLPFKNSSVDGFVLWLGWFNAWIAQFKFGKGDVVWGKTFDFSHEKIVPLTQDRLKKKEIFWCIFCGTQWNFWSGKIFGVINLFALCDVGCLYMPRRYNVKG